MRRAWGGQFTPACESNSVSLPAIMRPESGRANPAMESSRVDFPAPDGPKRMVMPAGTWRDTSSRKGAEPAQARCNFRHAVSVDAFTSQPTVSTDGVLSGGLLAD